MSPVGFEPTIPASELAQTHALERVATGISTLMYTNTHTHTHTYIYIYMCVCVYIYIYIYIKEIWSSVIFFSSFRWVRSINPRRLPSISQPTYPSGPALGRLDRFDAIWPTAYEGVGEGFRAHEGFANYQFLKILCVTNLIFKFCEDHGRFPWIKSEKNVVMFVPTSWSDVMCLHNIQGTLIQSDMFRWRLPPSSGMVTPQTTQTPLSEGVYLLMHIPLYCAWTFNTGLLYHTAEYIML
jgi:hypothetical protein